MIGIVPVPNLSTYFLSSYSYSYWYNPSISTVSNQPNRALLVDCTCICTYLFIEKLSVMYGTILDNFIFVKFCVQGKYSPQQ
jgi:hypothetical protein